MNVLKPPSQLPISALNSSPRDFIVRKRSLVTVARLHIAQPSLSTGNLTSLEQQLELCEHALDSFAPPLLHVNAKGKILWGSSSALGLLRVYWDWTGTSAQLPSTLRRILRWRSRVRARSTTEVRKEELMAGRDGASLLVRLVEDHGLLWLLLDERSRPLDGTRVQANGLTERETEVLQWLAAGKTNMDIAKILAISPRTVEKHVERIFQRLGVETRTAAAAEFYLLAQQVNG